jgi:hypothetical protein
MILPLQYDMCFVKFVRGGFVAMRCSELSGSPDSLHLPKIVKVPYSNEKLTH